MAFQAAPRRLSPVCVYASEYILQGQLEPLGHLLDDLDDPSKTGLLLHDAYIHPLVADSTLQPFSLERITANKTDFQLVYLCKAEQREELTLMKRTEMMIVYTSRFVIRGHFHMGGETRLRDFVDGITSTFLGISDATIYPLFEPSVDIPKSYPLLLINKNQIRLYHPPANAQEQETE